MTTGRTSEQRSVTVTRTSGSASVTGPADSFDRADAGRLMGGAGIPAGAEFTKKMENNFQSVLRTATNHNDSPGGRAASAVRRGRPCRPWRSATTAPIGHGPTAARGAARRRPVIWPSAKTTLTSLKRAAVPCAVA